MSILAAILVSFGLYATVLGTIFISFPYSRLSLYQLAVRHSAEEISDLGIRRLIMGMITIGTGATLGLSPLTQNIRSLEFLAYLGVACLIFGFLLLSNLLTAKVTKLTTGEEGKDSAVLLFEPWVSYMGTENVEGKDPRRNGSFELTHEEISFRGRYNWQNVTIPISAIQTMQVGLWHKGRTKVCPIIKIEYERENKALTVGFAVGKTRKWIDEILHCAKDLDHTIRVQSKEVLPGQLWQLRFKVYGFVAIGLTTVLAIAFAVARCLDWNLSF